MIWAWSQSIAWSKSVECLTTACLYGCIASFPTYCEFGVDIDFRFTEDPLNFTWGMTNVWKDRNGQIFGLCRLRVVFRKGLSFVWVIPVLGFRQALFENSYLSVKVYTKRLDNCNPLFVTIYTVVVRNPIKLTCENFISKGRSVFEILLKIWRDFMQEVMQE